MKIHHVDDYAALRRTHYPAESDQLHAVVKGLRAMMAGDPVPEDALRVLEQVEQTKQQFPKDAHGST